MSSENVFITHAGKKQNKTNKQKKSDCQAAIKKCFYRICGQLRPRVRLPSHSQYLRQCPLSVRMRFKCSLSLSLSLSQSEYGSLSLWLSVSFSLSLRLLCRTVEVPRLCSMVRCGAVVAVRSFFFFFFFFCGFAHTSCSCCELFCNCSGFKIERYLFWNFKFNR